MNDIQIILDIFMVVLWSITYVLALISTIKYKQPVIAPLFQLFVLPFEISALLYFVTKSPNSLSYTFYSYLVWVITSGVTLAIVLTNKYYNLKQMIMFGIGFVVLLIAMLILVTNLGHIFIFSYSTTFIGMVFWFSYIFKKDYRIDVFSLLMFVFKFIADAISIVTYFNFGSLFLNIICIALPVLDFAFIVVWIVRKIQSRNRMEQ